MTNKMEYEERLLKSINKLTGISISKIRKYAKENNPFNILEHPMVLEPSETQLEKIYKLNEFLESYNVLRKTEEENRIKFNSPTDAGIYFMSLLGDKKDYERFLVAFLDSSNSVIEMRTVAEGDVGSAVIYPRKILKMALANDCRSLMLAHNHPGGSTKASVEDRQITQKLVNIFKPLEIRVLDYIVVGGLKYSSMAEDGYLPVDTSGLANYEPIALEDRDRVEESTFKYENDFESSENSFEDDEEIEL